MGFRVEGVTEASLSSDVFVACLFQHSWRGLAGLSPSAFSEGVRFESRNRKTGLKEQGLYRDNRKQNGSYENGFRV